MDREAKPLARANKGKAAVWPIATGLPSARGWQWDRYREDVIYGRGIGEVALISGEGKGRSPGETNGLLEIGDEWRGKLPL